MIGIPERLQVNLGFFGSNMPYAAMLLENHAGRIRLICPDSESSQRDVIGDACYLLVRIFTRYLTTLQVQLPWGYNSYKSPKLFIIIDL